MRRSNKRKCEARELINIRETQIEDIFATYPDLLREILGIRDDITLIARQKILPSNNKIDLLFISGKKILLIELKIERFKKEYLEQVKNYTRELRQLQKTDKLIDGDIIPYLLCIEASENDKILCEKERVYLKEYSPQFVLENFFTRLKNLADFITLKPTNHGLWNIYLLNRIIYALDSPKSKDELAKITGISRSTVGSYLKLAEELLLVVEDNGKWTLTETGKKFVWNKEPNTHVEFISEGQSKILQNVIIRNPFASGAIFGIYTIVESLFNLSKNTYPVPVDLLRDYFRNSAGRYFDWKSKKTASDSMKMYTNYAIDIGLVGKIGEKFYLTPDGIRFILLLNLHKAIKIVDALGISKSEV